ncbi:hypothetical protein E1A91_A13G011400v1 [Gossypium mustelinum]|uniref:Uncharacterized protein n=1 Tax=Gossypium mustelinum TaxID=34275 RepID=A0A5D2WC90_GOSMU|nr:hypothetical protein E1A91_A13G011400v1 [Gossypium mustelinum]
MLIKKRKKKMFGKSPLDPAVQRKRAKEAVQGFTRGSLNSLTDSRSFCCPHQLYSPFFVLGLGFGLLELGLGLLGHVLFWCLFFCN